MSAVSLVEIYVLMIAESAFDFSLCVKCIHTGRRLFPWFDWKPSTAIFLTVGVCSYFKICKKYTPKQKKRNGSALNTLIAKEIQIQIV